jgi:2,3-bisphosphoglycerate-independent phosphoglycerate mutase
VSELQDEGSLERSPWIDPPRGPVVLLILDGVGVGRGDAYDAVAAAHTPTLDRLHQEFPHRSLRAHGVAVGLPSDDDMGNSEVGHNILGAGRIFDQGAKRVETALAAGEIWRGRAWKELLARASGGGTLHFVGLLSDGNVHSNIEQLFVLLRRAVDEGARRVRFHVLFDGRDVPDRTAQDYVHRLDEEIERARAAGVDAAIASGGGRMAVTMDRYGADWAMVERGWQAHVLGEAPAARTAGEAIDRARAAQPGISDQYIDAFTIVDEQGAPVGLVEDGDAVLVFNFRGDRVIELCQAFTEADFGRFDRKRVPDVTFAGMTLYDGDLAIPDLYLVHPEQVTGSVSELLAHSGTTQFACAETQKYGHVTYFWNGNRSQRFGPLETYLEIPSDDVPFDQRPWMKAAETADAVITAVDSGEFAFVRANFAGGDMVGHTANFTATVLAVEAIDLAIGRIDAAVRRASGCLVVTADHGNAEDKVERTKDGTPRFDDAGDPVWRTAHSLGPVDFAVADHGDRAFGLRGDLPAAGLANVAATVLELLGFAPPASYEPSLLARPQAAPASPVGSGQRATSSPSTSG